MDNEHRDAEVLLPPPPLVVVNGDSPLAADDSTAALLAGGEISMPGTIEQPARASASAAAPSGHRSYVGLAVDPKTRGLVAVEKDVDKPVGQKQHENHAAAAAAGVPLWITIENNVAWEWFKELDDDSSGELDMTEAKKLCVKLNLKVKNFEKVFAELDTGGDGTVSFSEFVHWFNERKTAERREMRLQIRDIFEKMDKDRSGCLSKTEIRTLVKKSGKRLNLVDPPFDIEKDWEAMHKTGEERDEMGEITKEGEVTFPHFEDWWKDRSGITDVAIPVLPEFMVLRIAEVGEREGRVERRKLPIAQLLRLPVKELSRLDLARMNFNDLYMRVDIEQLIERRSRQCGVALAPKNDAGGSDIGPDLRALKLKLRKDVMDELRVAEKVKEQRVSDTSQRTGREIVIDLLMEQKGIPGVDFHRSGRELWAYLRPRLRFIVELQKEWGNVHQLYPSGGDSLFEEVPLPKGIRDPDSLASGLWDLFGLLLLLAVSVLVPLRSCFDVEVEPLSGAWFFDLFTDVYFVVDLILNFFTAYHDNKGMREFRKHKIRWNYLKGWFLIDLVSCLPVGYVGMIAKALDGDGGGNSGGSSNTRAFKALRLLRLAKMLRIAKVLKIFEKYAESLSTYAGIYIMIFMILFLAHLMCCFWYMIGTSEEETPGIAEPIQGWVYQQDWEDLELVPLWTKYATALATVFAALENWNTDAEKLYAWFAEIMVGFIFGSIAGVMSQIMTSLKGNDQEFTVKLNGMKTWLKEQNFPKTEQKRVLNYFREVWKTKTLFSETEILAEMPPEMRNSLVQQLYKPVIKEMPLFKGLSDEIVVGICLRAKPMMAIKNQEIMSEGFPGREMFLLLAGEVEVTKGRGTGRKRLGFLSEGSFFGENPVLAGGSEEIRKRTVTAVTECKLCFLVKEDLGALMDEYPAFDFRIKRFRSLGKQHAKGQRLERLGSKSFGPHEIEKLQRLNNRGAAIRSAGKRVKLMVSGANAFRNDQANDQANSPNSRRGTPSLLSERLSSAETALKLQPEPPPGPSPTSRSSTRISADHDMATAPPVDTQGVERVVGRLLAAHSTEIMQAISELQTAQAALIERVEALSRGTEEPK